MNLFTIFQRYPISGEPVDISILNQFDFLFGNQIRSANIEIIAATARQLFKLPAGVVFAIIKLKTDCAQLVEKWLVGIS